MRATCRADNGKIAYNEEEVCLDELLGIYENKLDLARVLELAK